MDNSMMEINNSMNAQNFQNASANINNYPMSSSANSNLSKTPPQSFQSHCQYSDSQVMLPNSMPMMHYNNQYPVTVRHNNPNQTAVNPNSESCHYGYNMPPGAQTMTQIPGGGMHPEMMHIMSNYHFGPMPSYVPAHMMGNISVHGPQQIPPGAIMNQNMPPETMPIIHVCIQCQKDIVINNVRHQPIQCVYGCGHWYHRTCTGLSFDAYQLLRNEPHAEWICKNCESNCNRIWYIKPKGHGYFLNKFA